MNLEHFAKLVPIGTFAVTLIGLIFIAIQVRAAQATLRINAMLHRRELYVTLTQELSDDTVEAMKLHLFDHFEPDVFNRSYKGHDDLIRSYFLMKRKYFYLVMAKGIDAEQQAWDRGHNNTLSIAADRWIEELCQYAEFRDVHRCHKHYYPKFQKIVDPIIAKVKVFEWAARPTADTLPSRHD